MLSKFLYKALTINIKLIAFTATEACGLLLFVCVAVAAYLFTSVVVTMLVVHIVRQLSYMLHDSTNNKHTLQEQHDADA
jgi:hypothetical protein